MHYTTVVGIQNNLHEWFMGEDRFDEHLVGILDFFKNL